jgi:hypothetical protein
MHIPKKSISVALMAAAIIASKVLFAAPPDKDVNVVNTPDVNVLNTPDVNVANAPDVNVTNDATSPVPVLNVNDAMEPFQMRLSFNINAGSTQNQIDLPVPVGKRLIFEHASSRVQGPTGQQYIAQIQTSVFPNGSTRGVHWLVLTLQMNIPGLDIYTASQPMRIYAEPSTPSSLFIVTRSTSTGTAFAEVTISGYLVDL